MSRLIAIDPGVKMCGFAVLEPRALLSAGIVRAHALSARLVDNAQDMATALTAICLDLGVSYLVIERMRVYDKLQQKGDPNDLLDVSFVSGVIVGHLRSNVTISAMPTAREWKGTIEKPIHHERIKRDCPQAEPLAQKTAKTYRHNVYDAIGLGLWALERGIR